MFKFNWDVFSPKAPVVTALGGWATDHVSVVIYKQGKSFSLKYNSAGNKERGFEAEQLLTLVKQISGTSPDNIANRMLEFTTKNPHWTVQFNETF